MSWSDSRRTNQKSSCQKSAKSRTCSTCGKGAALRRDGTCRYCEKGYKPVHAAQAA